MASRLPEGAWDSHVHVVLDEDKYPLSPQMSYHPKKADLDDLLTFERSIGVQHVCLVAMSVYGTDNSSILDSLRALGGRGRGVVDIDPDSVSDAELDAMHAVGVRGVRLNLKTTGRRLESSADWADVLARYAERLRRFEGAGGAGGCWAIQCFVSMDQIALIAPVLGIPGDGDTEKWGRLKGVKVVFDHLGFPSGRYGSVRENPGYEELMALLREGKCYVKLSGMYRLEGGREGEMVAGSDLDDFVREILRTAPDQVVWASDWPHSGSVERNPGGDRLALQDYLVVDVPKFVERCIGFCGGDEGLMRKIWVDNPRRLWDYQD